MDNLKNQFNEMKPVIRYQMKMVQNLETRATQLVLSHLCLLAITLLVIAQPSSPLHHYWWVPFCFVLLFSLLLFPITLNTFQKWARTRHHYDLSFMAQERIFQQILLLQSPCLDLEVPGSPSSGGGYEKQEPPLDPTLLTDYQQRAYIMLVLLIQLASTVLVLFACRSVR